MESTQLTQFYQAVSKWPQTDGDLDLVGRKIVELLEAPFAAVILNHPSEKVAFWFADSVAHERAKSGVFDDFLKRQVKTVQELAGQDTYPHSCILKQIQLQPGSAPWSAMVNAANLTTASIVGDIRPALTAKNEELHRAFGWVFVASEKTLHPKSEVLLMAIAQHLSELAIVTELEGVIHLRSQFLSIASHELKTPLTSIYGILQLQERMLRMKKDDPLEQQIERQHSFLKMVIRQVERLNELIDGLLDVSRIQSGRFVIEPTDTDVGVILHDVIESRLKLIAQEAGVKLEIDAVPTIAAWVDPVRIEEVITNLVMNAIRFSPEGGVVWVRLREDAGSLRLTVRDQGPAVTLEDRERIFQPFERTHRTSRLGGLGLGLFISRQIAQLHGGNVSLMESLPGKGNVFEAYFPMRPIGAADLNLISASA